MHAEFLVERRIAGQPCCGPVGLDEVTQNVMAGPFGWLSKTDAPGVPDVCEDPRIWVYVFRDIQSGSGSRVILHRPYRRATAMEAHVNGVGAQDGGKAFANEAQKCVHLQTC